MAIDYQYYEFQSYEYLVRLGQLWEGMEELSGVQELLGQIRKEQELIRTRKFRVAVVGEFRRGKSTFVNALLGREILPTDALPTTATLNRITYGAVPKAYLCYRDGRREDVRIEELSRYVTKLTRESENAAAQIEEAVVEYPSIFCQNHVDLIDTPGMNDDMAMNDVTLSQLEHIDLAVVTLSPGSPFSETESRFMAKLLESEEICQIIVVVTKIDEIRGEEQRKKFLSYLSSQIPEKTYARLQETHGENEPVFEKFRRILNEPILFGVCSLDALEGRQYGDEELLERSGFAELNSRLPQIILASQNNNTVLRAVHTVRKIAEDYEKWLPALRAECEDRKEELKAGRKEFAEACYTLADIKTLDALKQKLWQMTDEFSQIRDETGKGFVRCLSTVRVLDADVIDRTLQAQAVKSMKDLNARIQESFRPELQKLCAQALTVWYQGLMNRICSLPILQESRLEKVREMAEELRGSQPFSTELPINRFSWTKSPVPARALLLAPDLIVYVRQAVSDSVNIWCVGMKIQITESLKQASSQVSKDLNKLVMALYQAENARIAQWEAREKRLQSPELLERLRKLAQENSRLEADFIKELSNTMEGEKGYE